MSDSSYQVIITSHAEHGLKHLDKGNAQRIVKKIQEVASNVAETKHIALKGNWQGYYKLRSGDYRAIYSLDHVKRRMNVVFIGHRSSVYKDE